MKGIGARGIQRTASDGVREGFWDEIGLGQHLKRCRVFWAEGPAGQRLREQRINPAKPQAFVEHCGPWGWRHRQGQIKTGFVFSGRILQTPDITWYLTSQHQSPYRWILNKTQFWGFNPLYFAVTFFHVNAQEKRCPHIYITENKENTVLFVFLKTFSSLWGECGASPLSHDLFTCLLTSASTVSLTGAM